MKDINSRNNNSGLKKKTIFIGFFLLVVMIGIFLYFNYGITGNVSLNVETNYDPNSTLDGKMVLSLKPGELIPKDSVVTISINESSYDFLLSDLVSEEIVSGDFYAEGLSLSGNGEGYGVVGVKESNVEVDFVMKISKGNSNSGNSNGVSNSDSSEETTGETTTETTGETTTETTGETTTETTGETTTETVVEEETSPGNSGNSNAGGSSENANENSNVGGGSILTGEVVANIEEEISGTVSSEEEYTYELGPGETASIVSSSGDVSLTIENGLVTINVDYSEEEGFGIEYLGEDYEYKIEIDLTALELEVVEGELVISLDYETDEIVKVSTQLSVDDPNQISTFSTLLPLESEFISDYALNTEQAFALKGKTGVDSVEITKAEERGNFLIIRFEAGSYWLENSYDKNIDEDDLKYQIELDRAKFAQRLAQSFLETETEIIDIDGYLGTESLVSVDKISEETIVDETEVVEEVAEESIEETTSEDVVEEVITETPEEVTIEDINEAFEEATNNSS